MIDLGSLFLTGAMGEIADHELGASFNANKISIAASPTEQILLPANDRIAERAVDRISFDKTAPSQQEYRRGTQANKAAAQTNVLATLILGGRDAPRKPKARAPRRRIPALWYDQAPAHRCPTMPAVRPLDLAKTNFRSATALLAFRACRFYSGLIPAAFMIGSSRASSLSRKALMSAGETGQGLAPRSP
jgi:hypothetical protein